MNEFKQHHDAVRAAAAGKSPTIVEVLGCKWSVSTVEAISDGSSWGPPRLTLEPVVGVEQADKAAGGKPLELEGLKFRVGQGGILIDGPAGTAPKHYGLTWQAVTALVDWLEVEFDKRKAEPTIADLIEQGHLPPLTGYKPWCRIMSFADISPEALTAAIWSGEGLPPVGCECEALWETVHPMKSEYIPVTVVGHDGPKTVYRWEQGPKRGYYAAGFNLRPLRTAEQLAAEAREKAIDIMQEHYERAMTGNSDRRGHASRAAIAALHDAGYRKSDA